ncbi:FecR domain-containing protein [Mucilaginibacter sp. RS28]|uniref:FecR domain-containing protein n=1 Tax=Mucilaginibacter straminoryzae TaxID=2932774 RepID=A0A9X2BD53_9SPHI|nr:FecR domain-containing protein [Mucilaginibacter straminoryzae]MCJ8209928.1 FecR domain-containing protein [Mucilaginibacter straminoryzae]
MNWELLINYVNGTCSPEEQEQVKNWVNEQREHYYVVVYLQERQKKLNKPLHQTDIDEEWLRLLGRIFTPSVTPPKRGSNGPNWLIGIAATLILISSLGTLWFLQHRGTGAETVAAQTVATRNNQELVILPDGTHVYMALNSKLVYQSDFGQSKREVTLNGEAFFDVKHQTKAPFIIRTINHHTVTVLGTSFNVYSRANHSTEVKVATGLVGVSRGNKTEYLKAGQQLVWSDIGSAMVRSVSPREAAGLPLQTLVFDNDSIDAIATKIERWYNVKVEAALSVQKYHRFSGEMKDTGLENLLKGLQYATGIHYKYKDQHTILLF